MRPTVLFFLMVPVLMLAGCTNGGKEHKGYTHLYQQAINNHTGVRSIPVGAVERFISLYSPLDSDYIEENLPSVYAQKIYFNDTLSTFYDREKLKNHLLETTERLTFMSLEIHNRWQQDDDVFLQWVMHARFSILGSKRDVRTIGISQLRFNEQGKVIFHQDFWDSSQGLDQQLPILGRFSRWLREHP